MQNAAIWSCADVQSSSKRKLDEDETDAASSFGDDESDHDLDSHLAQPKTVFSGLGDETEDEGHHMLPEAFAGHEIEDLAYGAGYYDYDYDIEREALGGWWGEEEDEEETEDEAVSLAYNFSAADEFPPRLRKSRSRKHIRTLLTCSGSLPNCPARKQSKTRNHPPTNPKKSLLLLPRNPIPSPS